LLHGHSSARIRLRSEEPFFRFWDKTYTGECTLEVFLSSTIIIAIAEIGDKSQLLSLFLASRFNKPVPIITGILAATLFNHTASALLGVWLLKLFPPHLAPWVVSGSFLLIALWLLIPDRHDVSSGRFDKYGVFVAATMLFFLVEIGDKTQIATVVLAAKYDDVLWVILGTTAGMLLANIPVVYSGSWIMDRIPLRYARWSAFVLFLTIAVITVLQTFTNR
jgi:putative Ca2+/H+ antiporter (TMEM165/GDT1 family)